MKKNNLEEKTYSMLVTCSNCGFSGNVILLKGVSIDTAICQNCGCRNLNRKHIGYGL